MFAVGDNWSVFEHTLTPLPGNLSTGSFLSVALRNSRNEGLNRESYSSAMPAVENEHFSLSETLLQQITPSLQNDANSVGGSSCKMSTSTGAVVISDGDGDDGNGRGTAVSCASSQLMADNSCDRVSIMSTEVQLLNDNNCSPAVDSQEALLRGHNIRNLKHVSRSKYRFCVNKPVSGKENTRPSSGSQSEISRLNARNSSDLERQIPSAKSQECNSVNQWRSPLRLTVSNVSNGCLAQSPLLSRGHRREPTVLDMSEGFSALSVVPNDSFDSCVDQHSPSRFSEDGLNSKLDEVQVYKRSSSTPVKDQSLHEPVRFRRQKHVGSPDKDNREQSKPSSQSLFETSPQAVDVSQSVADLNERSSTAQAVQGRVTQPSNTGANTADPIYTECLSVGALSANSSFVDSVMIGDVTYESTVLLPLPALVNADSACLSGCPEVGTQTSFLSSTYSANGKDASSCQKDRLRYSHNQRTDSRVFTSGNR